MIILFAFSSGFICFWRSKGYIWKAGPWSEWNSLFNVLSSYMIFVFLANLRFDKAPITVKKLLAGLSDLCFGIYLASNVFDTIFYPILAKKVPVVTDRFGYYFIIVPLVLACSAVVSFVANKLFYVFDKLAKKMCTDK